MEERKKRKKIIISAVIAVSVALLSLIIWLYKDEIKDAYQKWKAERAGWTEENLGTIELPTPEDIEPTEEIIYETDALGIKYKEYIFANKDYKVLLPADWDVYTFQNRVQASHPDFKNNYAQIEISIIPLSTWEEGTSLLKVRNDTTSMLDSSFKYHAYNDSYRFFIYELTDDFYEKDGFLYSPFKLKMQSLTVSDDIMDVYNTTYYTFLGNDAYLITVMGHEVNQVAIEEISKKVVGSFKSYDYKVDIENYNYSKLTEEQFLNTKFDEHVKYNIASNWEILYDSKFSKPGYGFQVYRLSNDINSPEYNMALSIAMVPRTEDLSIKSYGTIMDEMYVRGNYPEEIDFLSEIMKKNVQKDVKVYSKNYYSDGNQEGYISNYIKYCVCEDYYYNAIQVGNYPIYNYAYTTHATKDMDIIVNITHDGYENSELAYEYLMDFISKLSY